MVIAFFLVDNTDKRFQFFKKTFLLADISMDIALGIFFLILNNIKVNFTNRKPKQRLYTIFKAFSTIRWIELGKKKKFAAIIMNLNDKTFIVHIIFFVNFNLSLQVYPSQRALIASLKSDETLISRFSKYANFADFFFTKI